MLRINPQTEIEEIVQNVKTILSTPKGSVPLLRDFGISVDLIDTLTPELQMRVKEEVFLQIERWEKRAKVKKVSVLASDDGKAKITVTLQTRYGVVNVSSG
jgi:phage baseplate assembly protein W